jgi:hypothetical protein
MSGIKNIRITALSVLSRDSVGFITFFPFVFKNTLIFYQKRRQKPSNTNRSKQKRKREVRLKFLLIKTTILSAFASHKVEVRKNQKGSN